LGLFSYSLNRLYCFFVTTKQVEIAKLIAKAELHSFITNEEHARYHN